MALISYEDDNDKVDETTARADIELVLNDLQRVYIDLGHLIQQIDSVTNRFESSLQILNNNSDGKKKSLTLPFHYKTDMDTGVCVSIGRSTTTTTALVTQKTNSTFAIKTNGVATIFRRCRPKYFTSSFRPIEENDVDYYERIFEETIESTSSDLTPDQLKDFVDDIQFLKSYISSITTPIDQNEDNYLYNSIPNHKSDTCSLSISNESSTSSNNQTRQKSTFIQNIENKCFNIESRATML
ncbi:unnamed protein product [Didymodactylos carnosus]|uniref:Uncharacterized protein n=1 Tax=Didymodactylos carnosus TaxID=1234261 RepID=A0A814LRY6_9BILA|nr:unnamed protein product [Didymodactylos carnosus]CAF1068433.1 unnamed protein product [Didymodactylos carnosus]CAF3663060.1 unnamed protein product [Didymodactylos carnosus]CAF3835830.1 unnamed protein product [Didymodactylos carnosus]